MDKRIKIGIGVAVIALIAGALLISNNGAFQGRTGKFKATPQLCKAIKAKCNDQRAKTAKTGGKTPACDVYGAVMQECKKLLQPKPSAAEAPRDNPPADASADSSSAAPGVQAISNSTLLIRPIRWDGIRFRNFANGDGGVAMGAYELGATGDTKLIAKRLSIKSLNPNDVVALYVTKVFFEADGRQNFDLTLNSPRIMPLADGQFDITSGTRGYEIPIGGSRVILNIYAVLADGVDPAQVGIALYADPATSYNELLYSLYDAAVGVDNPNYPETTEATHGTKGLPEYKVENQIPAGYWELPLSPGAVRSGESSATPADAPSAAPSGEGSSSSADAPSAAPQIKNDIPMAAPGVQTISNSTLLISPIRWAGIRFRDFENGDRGLAMGAYEFGGTGDTHLAAKRLSIKSLNPNDVVALYVTKVFFDADGRQNSYFTSNSPRILPLADGQFDITSGGSGYEIFNDGSRVIFNIYAVLADGVDPAQVGIALYADPATSYDELLYSQYDGRIGRDDPNYPNTSEVTHGTQGLPEYKVNGDVPAGAWELILSPGAVR